MDFTTISINTPAGAGPKYEVRTAAQREEDARRNAPKYARERRVNGALTARHLKAKAAFDAFFAYDIDAAFDADTGAWRDELDPWLRFPETLFEFLRGHVRAAAAAAPAPAVTTAAPVAEAGDAVADVAPRLELSFDVPQQAPLSAAELRALTTALVRVAREDLAGAGRDAALLDDAFQQSALEYADTLAVMYELPKESAAKADGGEEDGEGEDAKAE